MINDPDFTAQFLVGKVLAERQNVDSPTATRVAVIASTIGSGIIVPLLARQLASREAPAAVTLTPVLVSITPNTGPQAQALDITIKGQNTTFTNASVIDLGAGVNVSSVVADSTTQLRAHLTTSPDAALGPRALKVTTGSSVVRLENVFTISQAPRLLLMTPDTGRQGEVIDVILGGRATHFTDASIIDAGEGIAVSNVIAANEILRAHFAIAADAKPGSHTVTVTSGSEIVESPDAFTVIETPRLLTITPAAGEKNHSVDLTITGAATHFSDSSVVVVESAVVTNFKTLSETQLSAHLLIGDSATPGAKKVTVTTGIEVVELAGAFTVNASSTGTSTGFSSGSDDVAMQLSQIAESVNAFVRAQESQEVEDRARAGALLEKAERQRKERKAALEDLCSALGSFGSYGARGATPLAGQVPPAPSARQDQPEGPPPGKKGEPKS